MLTNPISRFPTQDDDSHSHALEARTPLEFFVVQNIPSVQCRQNENLRFFQARVFLFSKFSRILKIDPILIDKTQFLGLFGHEFEQHFFVKTRLCMGFVREAYYSLQNI